MKQSLFKNGLYNTAAGVLRIGLGILTIPLLIRQLSPEEYGLWTLASTVIAVITLAEAGLSTTTTVFIAQDLGEENTDGLSQTLTITLTIMLVMATLAAIGLWLGADVITHLFPHLKTSQQFEVSRALQIGSLAVWARLVQQVLVGVEQAYQRYDLMNLIATMQSLLISIGMFIIVWLGGRTIELMQLQVIISMIALLSHAWVVKSLLKEIPIRIGWTTEKAIKIGVYSFKVWLSSLGGILFSKVDRLIVVSTLGTHVLGIYSAMTDITSQINVISALPIHPLIPKLSELILREDISQSELKQQIKSSFRTNSLVAIGLGAALITLSPFCLNFLFSGKLKGDELFLFSVCCTIYAIYSTNAVGYYILIGIKSLNICMLVVSVSGIVSLLLILIGASKFGLAGAIYGNAGYCLTLILSVLALKKANLPQRILSEYLLFPLLFLFSVFVGNIFIDGNIITRIFVFLFQTLIISAWYFYNGSILRKPPKCI
jgi:O-antigen/teichoic acid export membrane protein